MCSKSKFRPIKYQVKEIMFKNRFLRYQKNKRPFEEWKIWTSLKLRTMSPKDNVKYLKILATDWEKIILNHLYAKRLMSTIYKDDLKVKDLRLETKVLSFLQLNIRDKTNRVSKIVFFFKWTDDSLKKICK